jgi:hypothetical protein
MAGIAANAAVTGALSGPHDRYQARIAWLLPLAAILAPSGRALRGPIPHRATQTPAHPDRALPG